MSEDIENHTLAETIDNEITRGCIHAEHQCRKRRTDFWNIELHQMKRDLAIWCYYKKRRHIYGTSNSLIYLAAKHGINIPHDITLPKIQHEIQELRTKVLLIYKDSKNKKTRNTPRQSESKGRPRRTPTSKGTETNGKMRKKKRGLQTFQLYQTTRR